MDIYIKHEDGDYISHCGEMDLMQVEHFIQDLAFYGIIDKNGIHFDIFNIKKEYHHTDRDFWLQLIWKDVYDV